ncbi:MAG: signal recognition particle protein [Erysipelotrichia bacterium]|jgi:signal recognition particle subunit SRP54|nr:signal recognition particle protein [Erysipelotrichia bacterium]
MPFEQLSSRLTAIITKIKGQSTLDEKNMEGMLREIRLALLEADVNLSVINGFLNRVKEKSIGISLNAKVTPSNMVVKIVHDEIISILGQEISTLKYNTPMMIVAMVGLQGSGKTTSIAKLAHFLKTKQQKKVLLVAADLQRLAAVTQLKTLGNSIQVEVYSKEDSTPIQVVESALNYARVNGFNSVLVDTAGRLSIDEELMDELSTLKNKISFTDVLLSVDAMSGQDIINVAKRFNETIPLSGLFATKFDSDSKGGGVFSVVSLTGIKVKFVGVGEKIEDLELFYPDRYANRLLGMGDIVSLVEKAQETIDQKQAVNVAQKMMSGQFDFNDMLEQINQVSKMGSLKNMMKMLPGANKMMPNIDDDVANANLKKTKAIIQSMTKEERANPALLKQPRKERIAKGSGQPLLVVNQTIMQLEQTKEQMKQVMKFQGGAASSLSAGSNTKRNPNKRKNKR